MTSPRASSTVMVTLSPIITLSPARRVSTSIVGALPGIRGRTAWQKARPRGTRDRACDGASVRPIHDGADGVPGAGQHDLLGTHAVPVDHDRGEQVGGGL